MSKTVFFIKNGFVHSFVKSNSFKLQKTVKYQPVNDQLSYYQNSLIKSMALQINNGIIIESDKDDLVTYQMRFNNYILAKYVIFEKLSEASTWIVYDEAQQFDKIKSIRHHSKVNNVSESIGYYQGKSTYSLSLITYDKTVVLYGKKHVLNTINHYPDLLSDLDRKETELMNGYWLKLKYQGKV